MTASRAERDAPAPLSRSGVDDRGQYGCQRDEHAERGLIVAELHADCVGDVPPVHQNRAVSISPVAANAGTASSRPANGARAHAVNTGGADAINLNRAIAHSTKHDGLDPFSHKALRPSSLFSAVNPRINAPTFSGRSS